MNTGEVIFNGELEFFRKKSETEIENRATFDQLPTQTKSSIFLLSEIRRIIHQRKWLWEALEQKRKDELKKVPKSFINSLTKVFDEVKKLFIDYYYEKQLLQKPTKRVYEAFMGYLVMMFEKFEII